MIVDIHTHVFPDNLAARALEALRHNGGNIPAYTDATCAGLRASMRTAGIGKSLIMNIATKPSQVRGINQWAAGVNTAYPDLIAFGTLHPADRHWGEEILWMRDNGIIGVKLHPDYQGFFVDDPAMLPLYRALAEQHLILLIHAGIDIGLPFPVHCPPDRLARVLAAVPTLTVIAAHMGGYRQWTGVEDHLVGKRLFFDTSYSLRDLGAKRMVALMRDHGIHHILFGTDSPWEDQRTAVEALKHLPLTPEEQAAVLGGNAEKLLAFAQAQAR